MLKLGSGTGSLVNHMYSRATTGRPDPQVGDGATLLHWSDRSAATVIEVIPTKRGTVIAVQEDHAKRTDSNGMSEMQEYEYAPNPQGMIKRFRMEEGYGWRAVTLGKKVGTWRLVDGGGVIVGMRRSYYDFSF